MDVSKWFWLDETPGVEDLLSLGYTASNGTVFNVKRRRLDKRVPYRRWNYPLLPTLQRRRDDAVLRVDRSGNVQDDPAYRGRWADFTRIRAPVGANHVQNSWLSKYCYTKGALPTHYSNSGDTLESWATFPDHYKWKVFDGLAIPDALITPPAARMTSAGPKSVAGF